MFRPFVVFFFYCPGHHRDLHYFPTRRSSDLRHRARRRAVGQRRRDGDLGSEQPHHGRLRRRERGERRRRLRADRKSTRLNSSHLGISYAVFCLKKKKKITKTTKTK